MHIESANLQLVNALLNVLRDYFEKANNRYYGEVSFKTSGRKRERNPEQ